MAPVEAPERLVFELQGRIGVRSPDTAFSASFNWRQHDNDAFEIALWGPLGQGRTQIEGDAQRVTLVTAKGERFEDVDPQRLMDAELGWSVPVRAMSAWVRGQAAAPYAIADVSRDDSGNLTAFSQLGWSVTLRLADGESLPTRVVVADELTKVTVVCREWKHVSERSDSTES